MIIILTTMITNQQLMAKMRIVVLKAVTKMKSLLPKNIYIEKKKVTKSHH